MTTDLESLVEQFDLRDKPPVEQWKPGRLGSIDIKITRAGDWIYNGSKIERNRMVSLFSTILWHEDDSYYLITPVEKLAIEVEEVPFIAVLMDVTGEGEYQSLTFTDNTGNRFTANATHKLWLSQTEDQQPAPYVIVRRNLAAKLSRAVFYQLADLLIEKDSVVGVWSDGVFFEFS